MALDRKWINVSAVLTIATFTGPGLAFAASNAPYKPANTPPPVRQQFNNAAPAPPPKQKVNNASGNTSGAASQSGKPNTTTSAQTGGSKASAQALLEAFRVNAKDLTGPRSPKVQGGSSQSGSRNVQLDQEKRVPGPSNQHDKPTVLTRKRQQQQTPKP